MVETMTEPRTNGDDLEIHALSRSQVAEAADFTREQALALVGLFYSIQKQRVGQSNRVSAHNRRVDVLADTALVVTLKEDLHKIEKQAARGLKAFAKAQPLGRWAMQIAGVDGVLAAGLLAHIDVTKAATAGGIWRFAGLDPTIKWEKGQKRPYNAQLKVLCVHPDCHVTTKRGPIPISEVVIGDEVLTHKGRWRKVEKVFENDHDGVLYGLRSANAGNSVAWLTEGHPVYAAPVQVWKSGRSLKPNENTREEFSWFAVQQVEPRWKLLRPVLQDQTDIIPVLHVNGVPVGDKYVAAQGRKEGVRHPNSTQVLREIKLDPQIMRLIGLYLAEGHINDGHIYWSFHEDEIEYVDFVRSQIEKLTGSNDYGWVYHNPANHSVQVGLGCKPLADLFASTFGTNSYSVKFPHEWLSLPDYLLKRLWQGMMEGEGDHKGRDANMRFGICNGRLARQFVDLGRRLGKSVSLHRTKNGRAFHVLVNERPDVEPNARTTLSMPYTGKVYNLEVEEDHSYTVEGYAVHNCFKLGECFKRLTVSREKMAFTDSDLDALDPKKRAVLLARRANFLEEESYLYVRLYAKRKELLIQRNESGHYAEKAKQRLADMRRLGRKISEEQRDTWLSGKLQACGLDMMAMEHAVTIFLAHYHQVGREMLGLPVPRPWVVEHGGHSHVLPPPCWPMIEE